MHQERITSPIHMDDVKNYIKSRGVVFFVVYLAECDKGIKDKIYYNALLPYDLHELRKNYSD